MFGRKILVSLTSIICFVFIYLNSDSYLSENKPFITKETTKPTEESDKSLAKTTISTMDKVDSFVAINNADTDAFECFPDFTFYKKTWMEDAKQYFQSLDADLPLMKKLTCLRASNIYNLLMTIFLRQIL